MRERINKEVGVVMYYSAKDRVAVPHVVRWKNKYYTVGKIGYHHKVKEGQTLHHIYELIDQDKTLWFRLDLNTSNLHWKLDTVSDGLAS